MIKRVLYVCGARSFFAGHLPRKIASVVQCWRALGYEVKHVCGGDVSGLPETPPTSGISNQRTAAWKARLAGPLMTTISEWRDILHDRRMLAHLRNVCLEWKPELIWERSCRLHCAGLKTADLLKVPFVLEWKDNLINYSCSLFRRPALHLETRKIRRSDHVVVESEVLRESLASEGIERERVIVAHNAVESGQFKRQSDLRALVRNRLGVSQSTVLVGYIGSYAFYHDAARLVMAADLLAKQGGPQEVKILMVGSGKEFDHSWQLAEATGVLGRTLVMQPEVAQGEVPAILAALDIAVLPGSTDIICPIKVQEYMACELPTVVPDYPCNREVIREGETGFFFKPGDAGALASLIGFLAKNQRLREEVGRSARDEIVKRFSWEATWGAALNKVCARDIARSAGAADLSSPVPTC